MTSRYRYFALVSCFILAYFVITSQYLYHSFEGKYPTSLQSVTLFFLDRNSSNNNASANLVNSISGSAPNLLSVQDGEEELGDNNEITDEEYTKNNNNASADSNNGAHRVVVDVKFSTSVVQTQSHQSRPPSNSLNSEKQTGGNSVSHRPDVFSQASPPDLSQVNQNQDQTNVSTPAPPMDPEIDLYDPTTKWIQIVKDLALNLFGMNPDADLGRYRRWAVEQAREFLREEMKDFHFPPNKSLDDFVMERGGQPIRNVVFTTWRSGSTFLGEILHSHPGTFYHYEPLLYVGSRQVRGGTLAQEALRVLRELLNCRYKSLGAYMKNGEKQIWQYNHNKRLWNFCSETRKVCWDPTFLSNMCRLYPFQAMKPVRMRLKLARALLEDKTLNVRVLYLVRDPRGTIQSRFHRKDWCTGKPDCDNPAILCSDLADDYYAAEKLRKEYPDRFMLVRYEDMSQSIYNAVKKIFKFFRLEYHPQVQKFLDGHTKANVGGVSSVFRDTKSAPFHWIRDLSGNFTIIEQIQNSCREAMDLWGYDVVESEEELVGFNPVKDAPWPDMKIEPGD